MEIIKNNLLYEFRDFKKLFLGRLISSIGDKFFTIALAWLAISNGSEASKLQLGILMTVNMLPVIILGPFMGKLVDKYDKKKCMLTADFLRFLLVAIIFIAMRSNALTMAMLYVLCFFISAFIPLFEASVSSSLEPLTDSTSISRAVALDSSVVQISNIFGALAGGIAIAWAGAQWAIFFNALSFAISFLLILSIERPLKGTEAVEENNISVREGFGYIYQNKAIISLLSVFAVFNFFAAPLMILMPMMVKFVLNAASAWVGYFEAFLALGAGAMALALSYRKKYSKVYLCIFLSMLIIGIGTLSLGVLSDKYLMGLMLVIIGAALSIVNTVAVSLFQLEVPQRLKGRFFSILTTVSFAVMPLAYLVNSILAQLMSITKVLIINGAASIILALIVLVIPRINDSIDFDSESGDETPQSKKDFTVKPMSRKDAAGVAKCAYRAYGESYIHKYIYDSGKMWQLNKEGKLLSYVAVADNEQVIGHLSLIRDNKLVAGEISSAFVDPGYRGKGCLETLTEASIEKSRQRGDVGIYVHAVTAHPYSQRAAQKQGFRDCALVLSKITALQYNGICGENGKREDLMLEYQYLKEQGKKVLYAPEHHREIIGAIYNNLGVEVEFGAPAGHVQLPPSRSDIEVARDIYETAAIYIHKACSDVDARLLQLIAGLCNEGRKAIFLRVRLSDENTGYITRLAEKSGFSFSGVMPGDYEKDELILQYINEEIQFEDIVTYSEMGTKLLEYIKKCYYDATTNRRISI